MSRQGPAKKDETVNNMVDTEENVKPPLNGAGPATNPVERLRVAVGAGRRREPIRDPEIERIWNQLSEISAGCYEWDFVAMKLRRYPRFRKDAAGEGWRLLERWVSERR